MTEHLLIIYDNAFIDDFIHYEKIKMLTDFTAEHISVNSGSNLWLDGSGGDGWDKLDRIEWDLIGFQKFLKSTIFNACGIVVCGWDLQFDVSTAGIDPVVFWPQSPLSIEDVHAIIAGGRILHEIHIGDITDSEGLRQLREIGRFTTFNTTRDVRISIIDFFLNTRLHFGTIYETPQKALAV